MSHVSTYEARISYLELFKQAAISKGYTTKEKTTVNLFGRNNVEAELAIQLPGWRYDVAVTKEGEIKYDFFGSQKGEGIFEQLGELIQDYNYFELMDKTPWEYQKNEYTEKNGDKVIEIFLD
jgi:hypothetical protein